MVGELRRQSEVGNTLEFTNGRKLLLPPQPKGQRDKEVEPELRKPRERWNHGGEGALPEILHRAERERRNTLVFQLVTLQSLVTVSSVVHLNSKPFDREPGKGTLQGSGWAIQSGMEKGQGKKLEDK